VPQIQERALLRLRVRLLLLHFVIEHEHSQKSALKFFSNFL